MFGIGAIDIQALLLIFVRIGAVCMTAPVLSSERLPLQLRAAMSMVLAFLLLPTVPSRPDLVASLPSFALLLIKEAMVGLVLGYTANLIFLVVQMAGEAQDTQSGFGFAGVVDPNFSSHSAIFGQFQMVLMWLIFLTVDGHHVLLRAVADSFTLVPLGSFVGPGAMATHFFGLATQLMWIALRLSAPVLGAVLLTDLAMGMLQRTAPQLNLMAVGFQVKIMVAVVVVLLSLTFTLTLQHDLVHFMERTLHSMLLWGR